MIGWVRQPTYQQKRIIAWLVSRSVHVGKVCEHGQDAFAVAVAFGDFGFFEVVFVDFAAGTISQFVQFDVCEIVW